MPPLLQYAIIEYGNNPFQAAWFLFGHGGGLFLIPLMIRLALQGWHFWVEEKFKHHVPHVMYKIEVPQNNEQSMKAVEQIFVQLYGIHKEPDWYEKWWLGFAQEEFALEIVSDGGYITFYVRTPRYYKELTQAAFYAHYPDAILTEVEDYTSKFNADMINDEKIRVWGSEMKLESDDVKPIKPYPNFEHSLTGKAVDPLASMLEFMSRMQTGETLWYQILIQPTNLDHLKHRANEAIMAVVEPGKVSHGGPDIVDRIHHFILGVLEMVHKALFGGEDAPAHVESDRLVERQRLTTPEREYVEAVDTKASRWPFHTKVRFMYFAPPKNFTGDKVRRGMLGALKLYRFINAFDEGKLTRTDIKVLPFRFVNTRRRLLWRARKMYWAYRSRDMERGEHEGFVLSTEEIAGLFHFPQIEVRAPFVAKAQTRGVEPPTLLRYDEVGAVSGPSVSLAKGSLEPPTVNVASVGVEASEPPTAPEITAAKSQPTVRLETPTLESSGPSGIANESEAPANLPFV